MAPHGGGNSQPDYVYNGDTETAIYRTREVLGGLDVGYGFGKTEELRFGYEGGLSAGVLSVKLKYVQGTIGVQWSEVARLESNQLFLVKTESGTVYTGKLSTGAIPGERAVSIEVAVAPEKEVEISQAQLVKLAQAAQGFWQRFNGRSIPASFIRRAMNQPNTTFPPWWITVERGGLPRRAKTPAYPPAAAPALPPETRRM